MNISHFCDGINPQTPPYFSDPRPSIPLTLTLKNLYPWPGVGVFRGKGKGTACCTLGLPLHITRCKGWFWQEKKG